MNLTWPTRGRTGKPRPRRTIRIPWRWVEQYDDDLEVILYHVAENRAHATILAVHALAQALRKREKQGKRPVRGPVEGDLVHDWWEATR